MPQNILRNLIYYQLSPMPSLVFCDIIFCDQITRCYSCTVSHMKYPKPLIILSLTPNEFSAFNNIPFVHWQILCMNLSSTITDTVLFAVHSFVYQKPTIGYQMSVPFGSLNKLCHIDYAFQRGRDSKQRVIFPPLHCWLHPLPCYSLFQFLFL